MNKLIASNRYGKYAVPSEFAHRPAARAVLSGAVWERETIEFIRRNLAGRDIVHAGTFFGDFLPALSASAHKVWAFEPNPTSYEAALETINLNGLTNVAIKLAALSERIGRSAIRTHAEDGTPLGGASHIDPLGEQPVDLVCLDDVVPAPADVAILQLDVEGHEAEALRGAMGVIARCSPLIILETDQPEMMRSLKYTRYCYLDENVVYGRRRPAGMPSRALRQFRRIGGMARRAIRKILFGPSINPTP